MNTPRQELELRVARAVARLFDPAPPAPYVRPCLDARHGDFQTNAALVQAKIAQRNPREVAEELRAAIDLDGMAEPAEIAGPGFLNFRLTADCLNRQIVERWDNRRLGVPSVARPETVVIDYSGPNIAKEMHVGHLRSTILGDALARIYTFLGHDVVADNHLGDWGTGFGMILLGYKREGNAEKLEMDPFGHLEAIYQKVQAESKADETVREAARHELVLLQQGDATNRALWEQFLHFSIAALEMMYQRLGVQFDHQLGESFYNNMLAGVVKELVQKEIARPSEGAIAIFSDGTLEPKEDPFLIFRKEAGETEGRFVDNPILIQKSDGGYNYATTDLATIRYRHDTFKARRILYVVGAPQQMHFRQIFNAAGRWGYGDMQLEHVSFGTILGPDKKPFKSRSGETIKLRALLAEAEERAGRIIGEKRPELNDHERVALSRVVGLGALKYADLAQNRNLDYVFSWDKLLAFDGNTAPYLQNAYVRIRAIFRKAGLAEAKKAAVHLTEPAELALGRKLLDFADAVYLAAEENRPHYVCNYLFELATLFHRFYEHCPVLTSEESVRDSRLLLSDLTARTLREGLHLLGIDVVEQM
jgi:arginyl-tRNA synthetase